MKKLFSALMIASILALNACAVIKYTADGQEVKDKTRIFYVVAGLAPLTDNTVKAGEEYTVTHDFIDILIAAFTGSIIYSRTVTVK